MTNPMMNAMNLSFPVAANSGCDCKGNANHKVPRMPVMIDQAKANPLDVRAFMGKPLHTVLDADAIDGKMLQIFTNKQTADQFARTSVSAAKKKMQATTAHPMATPGVPPDGGYIELYEHIDFDGCSWRIPEANNHTVGNYGDLWACGFLFWGWKHANNTVSSIDVIVSADLVTFFDLEGINLGGSTFTVPGNSWIPTLVPSGWNDRISSHLLWYINN